jgi:hypothetical protein
MNLGRLDQIGSGLSVVIISLAIPQVLWPGSGPAALRPALIGLFLVAATCWLFREYRSGLLRTPLSKLPGLMVRNRYAALDLCATGLAVWVITFPAG